MALTAMKPTNSLLGGGKLLDVGLGFLTGGPAGAGIALLKDNNPALGKAADLASGGSGAVGRKLQSGADSAPSAAQTPTPEHEATIAAGVEALDHPDTPPDVAAAAAPYILGAHHFKGPHPMIDQYVGGVE